MDDFRVDLSELGVFKRAGGQLVELGLDGFRWNTRSKEQVLREGSAVRLNGLTDTATRPIALSPSPCLSFSCFLSLFQLPPGA